MNFESINCDVSKIKALYKLSRKQRSYFVEFVLNIVPIGITRTIIADGSRSDVELCN